MSNTPSDRALELAAQAWCHPKTSDRVMDVELAHAFAEILDGQLVNLAPVAQALLPEPPEVFKDWLAHEMPAGTRIGDPLWWAPRIWRQMRNAVQKRDPLNCYVGRCKCGNLVAATAMGWEGVGDSLKEFADMGLRVELANTEATRGLMSNCACPKAAT